MQPSLRDSMMLQQQSLQVLDSFNKPERSLTTYWVLLRYVSCQMEDFVNIAHILA